MSALIKSGARAVPLAIRTVAPPPDPAIARLTARVTELEQALVDRDERIATLDEALENAEVEIETARAEAEASGRAAGRAEAEDGAAARLELLVAAIPEALRAFEDALGATERLAAELARLCLDRMFGEPDNAAAYVADLLRSRLSDLAAAGSIAVTVSATDFGAAACAGLSSGNVVVEASPTLASGGCVIAAGIGEIDIGLHTQWAAIAPLLDRLAREGEA